MKLLKTGIDLKENLVEFINNSTYLFVFVPYIKLEALKYLLDNNTSCKAIFVRWETKDLINGASDLEIYQYCKSKGIALYRNRRLHLKSYVENYKSCFLGSPNISSRALNISETTLYNYELATIVNDMDIEDKLYFSIIEQDSTLITDAIYNQIVKQLPDKIKEYPKENDFDLSITQLDKHFLISALPLTCSIETLYQIYVDKKYINDEECNCVTHDLAVYKIPFGLPINKFKVKLEMEFFKHPFIDLFIRELNVKGEMYFGEVKAFIHNNCADVPLPRRWEITENIQILYRWIVKLGNGKFGIDTPNYSERLFIV